MSKPIDEIIRAAMERGEFDHLPKTGQPLDLNEYFDTPDDVRLAYSILKNANFLPEEAVLRQEIAELEEKSQHTTDPQHRRQIQKEIQARQLKYNLLIERFTRHRK